MIMTPTREQFRDFIAAIKKAQEKEYNVSDIDVFYDYLVEISNESNNKTSKIYETERDN